MKEKFQRGSQRRSTGGYFRHLFTGSGQGADPADSSSQTDLEWQAVTVLFEQIGRGAIEVLDRMQARIEAVKVYGRKTQINAVAPQAEIQIHLYRLTPGTTLIAVVALRQGEPLETIAGRVQAQICRIALKGAPPGRSAPGNLRARGSEIIARSLNRPSDLSTGKEGAA